MNSTYNEFFRIFKKRAYSIQENNTHLFLLMPDWIKDCIREIESIKPSKIKKKTKRSFVQSFYKILNNPMFLETEQIYKPLSIGDITINYRLEKFLPENDCNVYIDYITDYPNEDVLEIHYFFTTFNKIKIIFIPKELIIKYLKKYNIDENFSKFTIWDIENNIKYR